MLGQCLEKPGPCHALKDQSKGCHHIFKKKSCRLIHLVANNLRLPIVIFEHIYMCVWLVICDLDTKVTCRNLNQQDSKVSTNLMQQGEVLVLWYFYWGRKIVFFSMWHYMSEPVISEVMTWFAKKNTSCAV